MFVKNNQVCDVVRSARISQFFHDVVSAVYSMWIWEYQPHFLSSCSFTVAQPKVSKRTFENCSSLELGSLEVVITILGSWIPAREYSLSMWVVGSRKHCRFDGTSEIYPWRAYLPVHRQNLGHLPFFLHPSSIQWALVCRSLKHPSLVASVGMSVVLGTLGTLHKHTGGARGPVDEAKKHQCTCHHPANWGLTIDTDIQARK